MSTLRTHPDRPAPRTPVGAALVAIAALHIACTPLFYGDGLAAIVDHGVLAGVESGDGLVAARSATFWYVVCGLALLPLAYLCRWLEKQGLRPPRGLGWALVLFAAITIVLMPLSGFWLFLVPALMVLSANRPTHTHTAGEPYEPTP